MTGGCDMVRSIPCLRCETSFEQYRRSPSHFCRPCRVIRNREAQRTRSHRSAEQLAELRTRLPAEVSVHLEVYGHALGLHGQALPAVSDRMPVGTKSPAGPDEGRSTYFAELAGELDTLGREAAGDPWWDENPHWAFAL